MTEKNPPLVGVFDEHAKADLVIEQLRSAGIPDDRIMVFDKRSRYP
jgi:hypothetical protein